MPTRTPLVHILDYAAHAYQSWTGGSLREQSAEFWARRGSDLEEELAAFLGDDASDIDAFWQDVEANLERRRIRLAIVADELSPEVRRIIEFLNEELRHAELYGVEIRAYRGRNNEDVLVPNVVGQTQTASDRRARGSRDATTWHFRQLEATFSDHQEDPKYRHLLHILRWANDRDLFKSSRSVAPMFSIGASEGRVLNIVEDGRSWVWSKASSYPGGQPTRDRIVDKLKAAGFVPEDYDPESEVRKLFLHDMADMTDGDVERLLDILELLRATGKSKDEG